MEFMKNMNLAARAVFGTMKKVHRHFYDGELGALKCTVSYMH